MRCVDSEAVCLKRVVALILGGILVCSTIVVAGAGDLTSPGGGLLVQTQASSGGGGDAGSGGDASDARSAPTRLPGTGQFDGALDSESDVDWFGLSPDSTNVCVEAQASGSATTQVTLDLPGLSTIQTKAHKGQDKSVDVALAGAGASDIRFGFTNANDKARAPGDWSFALETFTASELLSDGDAGSGSDAGDTIATASGIDQGCSGGTLSDGDTADLYQVDADKGETITLSLADLSGSGDLQLDLIDGSGSTLMTVGHNEVGSYTFDADGAYYLKVHAPDDSSITQSSALELQSDLSSVESEDDYTLSIDGPEPRPCDPGC